jgi:hypothetical protein
MHRGILLDIVTSTLNILGNVKSTLHLIPVEPHA